MVQMCCRPQTPVVWAGMNFCVPLPPPAACCSAVKAAILPGKTRLVMVESPTNPRMQVRRPSP